MSVAEIIRDIETLERHLQPILVGDSVQVLEQARAQLMAFEKTTRRRARKNREQLPWEIRITSERSLKFRQSWDEKRLQPDLFCRLIGPGEEGWPFQRQEFVIRVWSLDDGLSYRCEFDGNSIREWLKTQSKPDRVLFRFHFDRAEKGAKGTLFHLQVGGKPVEEAREMCWFTGLPGLPRIPAPPMDLFMACELVAANFFNDHFERLCEEPEWLAIIRRAEQRTVAKYYQMCRDHMAVSDLISRSLLKKLWNK